jgi:hypothetical protein
MTDEEGERLGGPMRRFLLGLACGVALAGLVLGGLVAFTDLRLTTETTQDVAQRLLQASPPVERGSSTSSFKFTRTVPMLRGKPLRDATGFLRRAGFKPHVKNFCAPCSSMPVVVRQSPSPGTRVAKGDEVLLTVDTPAPGSQRTPHRPPGGPWTECDQIRSFPGEGGARGAVGISIAEGTCADAETFLRDAHDVRSCGGGGRFAACHVDGYSCKLNGEPHTGLIPVRCVNRPRRIVASWVVV